MKKSSSAQLPSKNQETSLQTPVLPDRRTKEKWKPPIFMITFFVVGLVLSVAHCVIYSSLDGQIVGDPTSQEEKIRYGTALSFLVQLSLTASIWESYTQWLWRAVHTSRWTSTGLNKAFSVDTSPSSLISWDLISKFKVGAVMAVFAWCLILPPFFTPATLFVYPSTEMVSLDQEVPYLAIGHSDAGGRFAYSPPMNSSTTKFLDDTSRTFASPRTVMMLLSGETARGEILTIRRPYNHSTYSVDFFGPIVKCDEANITTKALIDSFLDDHMSIPLGTAIANESAYFAFVPEFNARGDMIAQSGPRYQSPSNGTNELWMTFQRFVVNDPQRPIKERVYQVCRLFNATYHLDLFWESNYQRVNGTYIVHEQIFFPQDKAGDVSDMAQHAYTAFMWSLTDQVVGSFTWYKEPQESTYRPTQFGAIQSPIQGNSLLGSSDLDVYFGFQYEKELYKWDPDTGISPQRLQDKNLARNRTLSVLIEELSFNMTIGLLHNELLTYNTTTTITRWDDVNRYGYSQIGLFLPYVLANTFTLICTILGVILCSKLEVPYPGKKVQDIIAEVELLKSRTIAKPSNGPLSGGSLAERVKDLPTQYRGDD